MYLEVRKSLESQFVVVAQLVKRSPPIPEVRSLIRFLIYTGGMSAKLGPFPVEYMGTWVNGAGMGGLIPALMNIAILGTNVDFQTSGFAW